MNKVMCGNIHQGGDKVLFHIIHQLFISTFGKEMYSLENLESIICDVNCQRALRKMNCFIICPRLCCGTTLPPARVSVKKICKIH